MGIGPDFSHNITGKTVQSPLLHAKHPLSGIYFAQIRSVQGTMELFALFTQCPAHAVVFCIYIPSTECIPMYGVDLCCNPTSKAKRETCTLAHWRMRPSIRCSAGVDECSTIVIYKSFVLFRWHSCCSDGLLAAGVLFKTAAFVGEI